MKNNEPQFFEIDPNALDREWVNQPRIYHKFAKRLADARRDSEIAKTACDLAYAEVESKVRAAPAAAGIKKVTEAAIKAVIETHPKYKKAVQAGIDARHAADVLQAAVTTLDHRKKALENLVSLRLADYYSEPRARGKDVAEKMESARWRQRRNMEDGDE